MTESEVKSGKCRFCKSSISNEILKKIEDNRDDVYCENCGDLIKRVQNGYINEPKTIPKTTPNIPFLAKEPPQEVLINPDALLYPNGRIFYDTDFPQIFKSNFIIVFSRLVYFHALKMEKEGKIDMEELDINENLINEVHRRISPIHEKRIKAEFVKNLHAITLDEFELNLKKLQRKFHDNRQYREDFIIYSRWLIKRTLYLISDKWDKEDHSKFEKIILENLKQNRTNQMSKTPKHDSSLLSEKIISDRVKEYSLIYQKKDLPFVDFLKHQIKNLCDLNSIGILHKLIIQYKKTRRRAVVFSKGFIFSNSFKLWIKERYTFLLHSLEEIDNNYEILQYITYTLIEESNKSSLERKFLVNIADERGLSRWSITKIASILNQFGIIDYDYEYGIKSISEREKSKLNIIVGSFGHKALNNLFTLFFRDKFQKKFYSEPYIFKPISQKHPDGLINLNHLGPNYQYNFNQKLSKRSGREFYNYEFVILDYTAYSIKSIKNKIKKYYPENNILFLIIGIGLKDAFKDNFKKIYLPNNILVISPDFLRELIQIDTTKDKKYLDILNRILKEIKEENIDGLNDLIEETKTTLYSTNELENDLKVSQLSKIFYNKNKKNEIYFNYIKFINRDIDNLITSAKLPVECRDLAIKIIELFFESYEASTSIDHISYVAGSVYLAAKYLFLNQITLNKIAEKLKIDKTSIERRLSEFNENLVLVNYLNDFSIDKILKKLKINSQICKELTKEIIDIAYEKIFNQQIETNYYIIPTAIYLSGNNLGFNISQEDIVGSKNRSSIYNIINNLKKFEEEFNKFSVELEDIIKKKEEIIIKLIGESDGLTFNQINDLLGIYSENHLNNLILKGFIIEKSGFYYLSNKDVVFQTNIKNFEEFFDFYKLNPKEYKYSSNKFYYDNCPYLPRSTIRAWIHHAEKKLHTNKKKLTVDNVLIFILKNGLTSADQLIDFFKLQPISKKKLYEIINDLLKENILEKVKTNKKVLLVSKYSQITTFKEFLDLYNKVPKKSRGSSNKSYFEFCPDIPQNTVRTWIHRARKKVD